jgi:protein-tyrosine kinase
MSRIDNALEHAARIRKTSIAAEPLAPENVKAETAQLNFTSPYIIRFTEDHAPVTEEYRKLKSLIIKLMNKDEANGNTIMVTSSESGEGKSLTSINLALVLAQEYNHTVLLVDADLRRPILHTYLGLAPALGLTDCIIDGVDPSRAIIRTSMPRLSLLAAGKRTDKPAELISSNRMKALLYEVKHRYHDRFIIIDTPPALLFSETHVLSSNVDGVLFIVKEGVSGSSVRAALDVLKEAPLLGIVYNDAHPDQLNGRHKRYYQYYHRKTAAGEKSKDNNG